MTPFYRVAYAIFAPLFRLIFRIRTVGAEKVPAEGGFLICSNHTSIGDMLVLSATANRQISYMAKKELFSVPVLRSLIRALGAFPGDRGAADVGAVRHAIELMESGKAVGMFPQGTRCPGVDPRTTPIRAGVGMVLFHAKTPVVPVYLQTKANRVLPFRSTTVLYGDPISPDALGFSEGGMTEYKEASRRVFDAICALAEDGHAENR